MTLYERRENTKRQFSDTDLIAYTTLARIIGCDATALLGATEAGGAVRHHEFRSGRLIRRFTVGDFPKIVQGFAKSVKTANEPFHPWANVDTAIDFEVKVPSGATLVYKYESK